MTAAGGEMRRKTDAVHKDLESLGITVEASMTYVYKGHRYQNPDHAMAYAKLDRERAEPDKEPAG